MALNDPVVQKELCMNTFISVTLACTVLLGPSLPCVAAEVVPTAEVAAIATLADIVDTPQRL